MLRMRARQVRELHKDKIQKGNKTKFLFFSFLYFPRKRVFWADARSEKYYLFLVLFFLKMEDHVFYPHHACFVLLQSKLYPLDGN